MLVTGYCTCINATIGVTYRCGSLAGLSGVGLWFGSGGLLGSSSFLGGSSGLRSRLLGSGRLLSGGGLRGGSLLQTSRVSSVC